RRSGAQARTAGRSSAIRGRDRTGLSSGIARAAGVRAGAPGERARDAPGHSRAGDRRIAPASEPRKSRVARTHAALARAFARYQGVSEVAATRSLGETARRSRSE